ncbi:MAG: GldG family protein [Alphaproteobacteria bacterium]|nr:GldG family protein [Alphaproteobacteria bacterium]MBU0874537.1 GldG family protein [Alphaproteobacteria bacterium]MBU1769850.1 GldG family protein [Alphaproteobacteria bacterium]
MLRNVLLLAVTLVPAALALLLGLTGTALWTGRLDPLDWLLPGTGAIIFSYVLLARCRRQAVEHGGIDTGSLRPWLNAAMIWAVVTLPALLLLAQSAIRPPWAGMVALALGLVLVAGVWTTVDRRSRSVRLIAALGLGAASLLVANAGVPALREAASQSTDAEWRKVGLFSALPLQGVAMGAVLGLPAAESIGLRSPLLQVLEPQARIHPLDALSEQSLAELDVILLAQPRAMAPEELVALDSWVRRGGLAVILADPLLLWPDPRPLAHPARAPLTSLLDPLLTHWGLRLEAAEVSAGSHGDGHGADAVDRRILASGALLQLAGASRFQVRAGSSDCVLAEDGLIARCQPGEGRALLIADADWIDDRLWTLASHDAVSRRDRTSDAPELLSAWLRSEAFSSIGFTGWMRGEESLVLGLRSALLLLLALSLVSLPVVRRPLFAQPIQNTNEDHKKNIRQTEANPP